MNTALARSLMRLFTYQGSWSFDRLQGIGMGYCVEPLLRTMADAPDGPRFRRAVARSASYFNTHPFLAGLAVGAVARAEVEGVEEKKIDRLRTALKGPLGSIGDRLVWSGALPVASAAGVVVFLLGRPLLAPVVFLLLFNGVHLPLRVWSLWRGWRLGLGVAGALQHRWLQRLTDWSGPAALLALGAALPMVGEWLLAGAGPGSPVAVGLIAVVTIVVSQWVAPMLGAARIGAIAVATTIVAGVLWR